MKHLEGLGMRFEEVKLQDVADYVKERMPINEVLTETYVSTENLLPNKSGKTIASAIPNAKTVIKYQKKDVLISNIRPYFKKIWFSDTEGGASSDVLVIRSNEKVEASYLYYFLSQDKIFDYMVQTSKGTKMPRGDKDALMKYPVFIPDLNEQRKVSYLLSNIDHKININNITISNLEQLAQTLFKHWFVDFEFPNEEGKPYKSSGGKMVESELGMIPEGWEVGVLSDVSQIVMGQSPKSSTYNEDGIGTPLINGASDFKKDVIAPLKYTSDPKRLSEKDDYLFGVRATVGNVTYVDKEYALGRGVGIARAFNNNYRECLYFQLINGINRLKSSVTGSVYINFTRNDLTQMKLIVGSQDVISLFHEKTVSLFEEKYMLLKQNKILQNLRDTLLPKLLSGEIELPDDLEVGEDV